MHGLLTPRLFLFNMTHCIPGPFDQAASPQCFELTVARSISSVTMTAIIMSFETQRDEVAPDHHILYLSLVMHASNSASLEKTYLEP